MKETNLFVLKEFDRKNKLLVEDVFPMKIDLGFPPSTANELRSFSSVTEEM